MTVEIWVGKFLPLDHVILSRGYPLAGQTTRNSLPTTAFSSGIGCTNGGPTNQRKCWKSNWLFGHSYEI